MPDGIFETAARKVILGPSAEEHSILQRQSLKEEQYEGETCPANLAGLISEQYDMQVSQKLKTGNWGHCFCMNYLSVLCIVVLVFEILFHLLHLFSIDCHPCFFHHQYY